MSKTDGYRDLQNKFQLDFCGRCKNVGLLRVEVSGIGTLARCCCKQGLSQAWLLPEVRAIAHLITKESSVPEKEFHPGVMPKTQEKGFKFTKERLAWFREKIAVAEEFWKSRQ